MHVRPRSAYLLEPWHQLLRIVRKLFYITDTLEVVLPTAACFLLMLLNEGHATHRQLGPWVLFVDLLRGLVFLLGQATDNGSTADLLADLRGQCLANLT